MDPVPTLWSGSKTDKTDKVSNVRVKKTSSANISGAVTRAQICQQKVKNPVS